MYQSIIMLVKSAGNPSRIIVRTRRGKDAVPDNFLQECGLQRPGAKDRLISDTEL
jgi:hypothetical protein